MDIADRTMAMYLWLLWGDWYG